MKKLSLGKQADIVKATIPQPYPIEFEGETIEINPVLALNQKQDFTEIVWSLYYSADKDGNFDFRPYTFDFAVRLATIYCYTNVKIDFKQDVEKYYSMAQYSGLYEAVTESFDSTITRDHKSVVDSTEAYIDRKCDEMSNVRVFAAKSQIDFLIETVLTKASVLLDSFKDESGKVNIQEVFAAVSDVKKLADQDTLVRKILNFRDKQEGSNTNGAESGSEGAGVSELPGGPTEN